METLTYIPEEEIIEAIKSRGFSGIDKTTVFIHRKKVALKELAMSYPHSRCFIRVRHENKKPVEVEYSNEIYFEGDEIIYKKLKLGSDNKNNERELKELKKANVCLLRTKKDVYNPTQLMIDSEDRIDIIDNVNLTE